MKAASEYGLQRGGPLVQRAANGKIGRVVLTPIAFVLLLALLVPLATSATAADQPAYLGAFGPDGTSASDFERVGPVAVDQTTGNVYVGDSDKDVIYKFDETGQPVDFGGSGTSGNELSVPVPTTEKAQLAFDSDSQVLYLTSENKVRAFEANGEPHEFTSGPGAGTSEIPGAGELRGVAVDVNGNIYASDHLFGGSKIRIYSRDGALLNEINSDLAEMEKVAVTPRGDVIVISSTRARRLVPSNFPISGSTTYSLDHAPLDPSYTENVGVDPGTGFIYLGQFREQTHERIAVFEEDGTFLGSLGDEGQEGELPDGPQGIAIGPNRVYATVNTERTDPHQIKVRMYELFKLFVGKPTVGNLAVSKLTATSGTLTARINPNTLDTTYWFEYGLEDCAANPGSCTVVPVAGEEIGAGHEPVTVSRTLTGLEPGTRYFYRVAAENSKGTESASRTFTTQGSVFNSQLSDGRVWEQASPVHKAGGTITNAAAVQAAADGSGIVYLSRGAIVPDPEGDRAFELSAVLARRSGSGQWSSEDLVPPHTRATQLGAGPEYKVFSSDLGRGVLEPRDETPLSVESSERTPYLRINSSPRIFRPLVTSKEGYANVPAGTEFGGEINGAKSPVALGGANRDLTDLVLTSETSLLPGVPGGALLRWEDGNLTPVSKLPPSEKGGKTIAAAVGSGADSVHHAVSEDGSRIFWSPGEGLTSGLTFTALYVRDMAAEESARIDLPQSGADEAGEAHPAFMGANADGSVVFFTDSQHLTADANPGGRDLYRCELGDVGGSLGCADLSDLTAGTPAGEASDVKEIGAGLNEDGTILYFVAEGVLDAGPNESGDTAQSETPNLYLWREGTGVRYIATLSPKDESDWGAPRTAVGAAGRSTAYSSPSGRYLTFMSQRNLAGDESDDPATGQPTQEVFLYDASAETLRCVSCNPNGATDSAGVNHTDGGPLFLDSVGAWPEGLSLGATLPVKGESEATKGYNFYEPRAVLDNGRVFYNSVAPLVPADSNGTWDVYQYEPLGVGSCGPTSGSGSIARSGNGCVSLISSGTDSKVSLFLDASESGDDLFFGTSAKLAATDVDNDVDVYDAKVDGVEAVVEKASACEGEACHTSPPAPIDATPSSAFFRGAGNVKAKPGKHCRKGQRKVKRKGKVRCVKRRAHHAAKSHKSSRAAK